MKPTPRFKTLTLLSVKKLDINDFYPLAPPDLCAICQRWIFQLDLSKDCRIILDDSMHPRIVPLHYLFDQINTTIQQLETAELPYFDISDWEKSFVIPGMYDSREKAISDLSRLQTRLSENKTSAAVVIGPWVISAAHLDQLASGKVASWETDGVIDCWEMRSTLPTTVHDKIVLYLNAKLIEIIVKNGHARAEIVDAGRYILSRKWLDLVCADIKRVVFSIADKRWNGHKSLRSTIELPEVLSGLTAPHAQDRNLFEVLWNRSGSEAQLSKIAKSALDERIGELEQTDAEEFAAMWRDKIVHKLDLYNRGVAALDDGTLKDQLSDLLNEHIIREMVPQMYKRAVEKQVCRNERVLKLLQKVVDKLRTSRDLASTMQELEKFGQKLDVAPSTEADLVEAKGAEIKSWLHVFRTDKNDARRFICAVLILYSKQNEDLIYATAKFAPKLLRLLKELMDGDAYRTLETMKDGVKAGTVQADTANQVEQILKEAIDSSEL